MYNYNGFLNENNKSEIAKIAEIIMTKTNFKIGDIAFLRGDNRKVNYITGFPRKRNSTII